MVANFWRKKVRICVIVFLAMNQALSARLSTTPNNPTQADLTETRSQLLEEFADVFDNTKLKPMAGPLMDTMLKSIAQPHHIYMACLIPFAYCNQVKQQIDDMVCEGISEPVSQPTDWCHPVVKVNKRGNY